MTRSRLCRFRSTNHRMFDRPSIDGSAYRLPDDALIELGVPDDADVPAAGPDAGVEVRQGVLVDQRGEVGPTAPSPTAPVEKSTVSGSLVLLG